MVRTFKRVYTEKKIRQAPIVSYVVPVMVFLDSIPKDNILHRYLFPENAEITSFLIKFNNLKGELKLVADLKVEGGGEYVEFDVKDGVNKLLESKVIIEGTSVELKVVDYSEATHGNPEVWISYLYRVIR